jgi:hypothetical protein
VSPEVIIGLTTLAGLALFGCWRLFKWFCDAKPRPEPWGQEIEQQIHQPDAVPICTRCLEPHLAEARFCPNCGVPVDALVPFSPYLYLFAFGDMLRTGTTRKFQVNWITVLGFLLLPLAFLPLLLAFVYWFFFLRNLARLRSTSAMASPGETDSLDGM